MATNGIVLLTPSSVDVTGSGSETATINTNGSITFSACATLSLNDVFSSTYDNYLIDMRHLSSASVEYVRFRLRASGSDNSTASSYVYQRLESGSSTVAGSRTTSNEAHSGYTSSSNRSGDTIYIYGPNLAQPTAGRSVNSNGFLGALLGDVAWTHNQSTAYDGFSIYPPSGTLSGLIKVYGLVQ
jgi:hypothetical protein